MIVRIAVLVALVAAPAAFAVGWWQGLHPTESAQITSRRLNAPQVQRPGEGAAAAAKYLASLKAPPPPPPGSPTLAAAPAAAPRPPPIDVGVEFRREVSAVLVGPEPHVLLASGRRLAKGQVYRDGWRVRELTGQSAVLAKGRETRSINLFSAPPRDPNLQLVAAPGPVLTSLSLGNAVQPGKLTPAQIQGVLDAFRTAGAAPNQLDNLKRALEAGGPGAQGQAMNMMMQLGRNRQLTLAQTNAMMQALIRAGLVPQAQGQMLTQLMSQAPGAFQVFGPGQGGGNRGGGGGGRGFGGRGANIGFGGGPVTMGIPAPAAPPPPFVVTR